MEDRDTIPAFRMDTTTPRLDSVDGWPSPAGTATTAGPGDNVQERRTRRAKAGNENGHGAPMPPSPRDTFAANGYSGGAAAEKAAALMQQQALLQRDSFLYSPRKGGLPSPNVARRLWALAWPLSWMEVLTFTKELIITAYVGRLGALELSALVLSQTLYNVTGNAPMLGVVTAMETFCGQAYGARRYKMVGTVLQRAAVLTTLFCMCSVALWTRGTDMLLWMGQDEAIAREAGRFTLALAPALVMDGLDQCCRRYLSAQAVVQPLMAVTLFATLLTPLFLHLFVYKWGMGLIGAAVAWDLVQATSLVLMASYCTWHTLRQEPARCTWGGWTLDALKDWGPYVAMALPSMIMICLDWWTFEVVVMLSGLLPQPELTMSMMGITFNIHALCFFAAHGLSGAASTRVANDLGAGRPRLAWLTTQVAVLMGTLVMCACSGALLLGRHQLGWLFTSDAAVVLLTAQAVPPLAVSLIGEGANTVLAGIMRGCGRQQIGATVNLVTYWVIGLPCAVAMAFYGGMGALGLWTGLACTASVQALLMTLTVFKFDWHQEAQRAQALVAAGELLLDEDVVAVVPLGSGSDLLLVGSGGDEVVSYKDLKY